MAHIIVVGNEKGGAGKSTVSMHISTALARLGHRVSVLDLDFRQQSLARYIENRANFCQSLGRVLPSPVLHRFDPVPSQVSLEEAFAVLDQRLAELSQETDFFVIDCPGSHTEMSQAAHSRADTLVTPLNDSFVDFDLLARIGSDGKKVLGPSIYSEMVWSARQKRALAGKQPIDWVVLRNRLGSQNMLNKRKVGVALENLAKRIGFRTAPGFSERVIFRELFPKGLTLLDLKETAGVQLNVSNIAARQEVREMLKSLNLPGVVVSF